MMPQHSGVSCAAQYGNSRIVLGAHYPLDIIASRAFAQYDLARMLSATAGGTPATNPYYYTNATYDLQHDSALNLNGQFVGGGAAVDWAQRLPQHPDPPLAAGRRWPPARRAIPTTATPPRPMRPKARPTPRSSQYRQTYGIADLFLYARATRASPRGRIQSTLLSTLYGGHAAGSGARKRGHRRHVGRRHPRQPVDRTINQIIANTETQALTAFDGTPSATGAGSTSMTPPAISPALPAADARLDRRGQHQCHRCQRRFARRRRRDHRQPHLPERLVADRQSRACLTVKSGAVTLQNRARVALGKYAAPAPKLIQADAGQTVSLRSPGRRRRLRALL